MSVDPKSLLARNPEVALKQRAKLLRKSADVVKKYGDEYREASSGLLEGLKPWLASGDYPLSFAEKKALMDAKKDLTKTSRLAIDQEKVLTKAIVSSKMESETQTGRLIEYYLGEATQPRSRGAADAQDAVARIKTALANIDHELRGFDKARNPASSRRNIASFAGDIENAARKLGKAAHQLGEETVTEAWGGSPKAIRATDVVVDDDDYGLISIDGTTVGHFRADKGFATVNVDGSEVDFRARTAKDVAKHIAQTYRLDKFLFQLV